MTKHRKLLLDFALFSGLLLVATAGAHSTCPVTNLSLEKQGDFTYFTIFAEDKIEFTHFVLPSSGDKPDRIVVDLEDAVHRLPKNNFRDLPASTVRAIRTSQYQVEPKKITRIVLDLKKPVIYSVVDQKEGNRMTLSLSTKKDPPSIFWAADPEALKTKTEFPEKGNAKVEERKEFARQESTPPPVSEPVKAKIKPETKKEKPKDHPLVKQKPRIQETETVTAADKTEKKKDQKIAKKTKEVKTETGLPEAPDMAELPRKEEVSEASKIPAEQAIPFASMEVSAVQPATVLESEDVEEAAAQRESLVYLDEGRRDPFIPVSEEMDIEFGEMPLPAVENLRLVGTLGDHEGFKALLEDDAGFGYLLRSGDKVKNGFVVNVFKDKIFFQVEEYGWSRVISLELPPEY